MGTETVIWVQEVQQVPGRLNPKKEYTETQSLNRQKLKKENIFKKIRKARSNIYVWYPPVRVIADFSAETLQAKREWNDIFQVMNG